MYDMTEEELDERYWAENDMDDLAPKTADDEFVRELGHQIFEPGSFTHDEHLSDETAEREFAATVFPTLKDEILRQAKEIGESTANWSVRFDVDASTSRQRGAKTDPHATVSVLVVEGPVDPDIS